ADLDSAELEPPPDVQEGYGRAAAVVRPAAVEGSGHGGSHFGFGNSVPADYGLPEAFPALADD
ncbi:hypothetical protein, partial [Marinobacter sp.]|uniref:hypothetical protein n=1 Tax=Marinobacter sp. TaxID=50741 RepID=UPI003564DF8B